MSRPLPLLPLVTQTDSGDAKGWDDCGPSSSAMALFRGTGGKFTGTWREVRAAMERNGVHDVRNVNNPTTPEENVAAILDIAPELKKSIFMRPDWASLQARLIAGDGYVGCYYYGALPEHARAPKFKKGTFGHFSYFEGDTEHVYLYDPLRPAKSDPVLLTWDEFRVLVHWGVAAKNAHRPRPGSFGIKAGAPVAAPAPAPSVPAEAPRSHAEAPKASGGTPTPPEKQDAPEARKTAPTVDPAVQAQIDALGKVDWGKVGGDALELINEAAAASGKEKGMKRILAGIKYIAANSQIDEMLLDAVRTFLTVSISVALGLGIPLLDIQGGDFRTIVSAGLASALQIIVKALDPQNSAYGIKR